MLFRCCLMLVWPYVVFHFLRGSRGGQRYQPRAQRSCDGVCGGLEAERTSKVELDSALSVKHTLEAALLKEQESCRALRGKLQGSKDRQGMLGQELTALKEKLGQ